MPEQNTPNADEKNVIHLDENATNGADSSVNLAEKFKDSLKGLDSLKTRFANSGGAIGGAVSGVLGKISALIAKRL